MGSVNHMMSVICDICTIKHRIFLFTLFSLLQDEFDNPCSGEVSGKAIIEIVNSSQQGAAAIEKPELAGHSKRLTMLCLKGRVTITVGIHIIYFTFLSFLGISIVACFYGGHADSVISLHTFLFRASLSASTTPSPV